MHLFFFLPKRGEMVFFIISIEAYGDFCLKVYFKNRMLVSGTFNFCRQTQMVSKKGFNEEK